MNLSEVAAILALVLLGWILFGRRGGWGRWVVLVIGAALLARSLTG